MKVIGTAGHVDHGKSALVLRLTGIDPDRLVEEKRRGMTIDLGFASLTLPSGRQVSLVDVPGHERFVKNMLAGAAGVDIALLVVAADESVMPQTREHLAILDLLGVGAGVVALTKSDLVDEELRDLAMLEVNELLTGTVLEESTIVPVSSITGEGVDELLAELERLTGTLGEPQVDGVAYLPVDRVFSVAGFGTVVTGTLHGAGLRVGDEVELTPGGGTARIRGLQIHGTETAEVSQGTRAAVNLAGVARSDVQRGQILSVPGAVRAVRRFDVHLSVVPTAPAPLRHGDHVAVHVGAAEQAGIVTVLAGDEIVPGASAWAQIRTAGPIAAIRGQRFIVRLPAPVGTVGGGEIVDLSPHHRRRDAQALSRLESMKGGAPRALVRAYVPADRPRSAQRIAALAGLALPVALAALEEAVRSGDTLEVPGGYLAASAVRGAMATVIRELDAYHREFPLRAGMPREELRRRVRWPQPVWNWLVLRAVRDGEISEVGTALALKGHRGGVGSRRAEADRVLALLRRTPYAPPDGAELLRLAETDAGLLHAMTEAGEVVRVGDGMYLAPEACLALTRLVLTIICDEGQIAVARLRDDAGTTRKYALSFLEYLDGQHITRRQGDARVLGSKAPACE